MHRQPQPGQPVDDGLFPAPQLPLAVAEQRKIIDVAQIRRAAQLALDEVIEGVERQQ